MEILSIIKRRAGFIMMPGIIAGLTILSVVSVTFAGVISTQLVGLEVSKIALQTQQFAENKANEISLFTYSELNKAELPRQAIIGTPYQEEVIVGTEISLGGGGNKQRTVTINIYKPNESLPRFSLDKLVTLKSIPPGVPTGTIIWFGGSTPPTGFLLCNGQSTSGYPELASVVGAYVPDLRGEFIRGVDLGRGADSDYGRSVGSWQGFSIQSHNHTVSINHANGDGQMGLSGNGDPQYRYFTTSFTGGTETRPRNIALLPCIKT